jgi:hypothetical protein
MTDAPTPDDNEIAELMNRDPLKHTEQDLDGIISYLRKQRHRFTLGNAKAGTPVKKKTAAQKKAEAAEKLVGNVDLDLDL